MSLASSDFAPRKQPIAHLMDLISYLEGLPPGVIGALYGSYWTCRAVLRGLPPLAKQYVMRLVLLDEGVAEGKQPHLTSLDILRQQRGLQATSRKDATKRYEGWLMKAEPTTGQNALRCAGVLASKVRPESTRSRDEEDGTDANAHQGTKGPVQQHCWPVQLMSPRLFNEQALLCCWPFAVCEREAVAARQTVNLSALQRPRQSATAAS